MTNYLLYARIMAKYILHAKTGVFVNKYLQL